METLFLDWGLSHTWSKIIPYLLTVLFGLFLAVLVYRRFKSNKKMAIVLSLFFLIVPFIGYFAVNPIYQGDFSDDGKEIHLRTVKTTAMNNGLLVLAIPGCPYCLDAIEGLKKMKSRRPKLKIEFNVIDVMDEASIAKYEKAAAGKFKVKKLNNSEKYTNVTGQNFPTFIMVSKGKAVKSWTNNQFGVRAKDRVENW